MKLKMSHYMLCFIVKGVCLFFFRELYPRKAQGVQLWECLKTWTSWFCKLMCVPGVTSFIRKDSCGKFSLCVQEEVCGLLILCSFLQGTRGGLRKVRKMFCLCYTQSHFEGTVGGRWEPPQVAEVEESHWAYRFRHHCADQTGSKDLKRSDGVKDNFVKGTSSQSTSVSRATWSS